MMVGVLDPQVELLVLLTQNLHQLTGLQETALEHQLKVILQNQVILDHSKAFKVVQQIRMF